MLDGVVETLVVACFAVRMAGLGGTDGDGDIRCDVEDSLDVGSVVGVVVISC